MKENIKLKDLLSSIVCVDGVEIEITCTSDKYMNIRGNNTDVLAELLKNYWDIYNNAIVRISIVEKGVLEIYCEK